MDWQSKTVRVRFFICSYNVVVRVNIFLAFYLSLIQKVTFLSVSFVGCLWIENYCKFQWGIVRTGARFYSSVDGDEYVFLRLRLCHFVLFFRFRCRDRNRFLFKYYIYFYHPVCLPPPICVHTTPVYTYAKCSINCDYDENRVVYLINKRRYCLASIQRFYYMLFCIWGSMFWLVYVSVPWQWIRILFSFFFFENIGLFVCVRYSHGTTWHQPLKNYFFVLCKHKNEGKTILLEFLKF